MTLVGKILTLLILLLSVCFLLIGITINASHQAWHVKAMANKTAVEVANRQIEAIKADNTRKQTMIETEKVQRMLRIQQLESQLQLVQRDLNQRNTEFDAQKIKASEASQIASENEKRLTEQDQIIASLSTRMRTLTEDIASQRERVIAMTTQIFELEGKRRSLESLHKDLGEKNALLTKVLKKNGLLETDLVDHIPPAIEGRVYAVQNDTIAFSLGTDDGMREGHVVDIFRGNRFVGTAEITVTQPNRSAARIDKNLTKFAIETGDRITTNWVRDQK